MVPALPHPSPSFRETRDNAKKWNLLCKRGGAFPAALLSSRLSRLAVLFRLLRSSCYTSSAELSCRRTRAQCCPPYRDSPARRAFRASACTCMNKDFLPLQTHGRKSNAVKSLVLPCAMQAECCRRNCGWQCFESRGELCAGTRCRYRTCRSPAVLNRTAASLIVTNFIVVLPAATALSRGTDDFAANYMPPTETASLLHDFCRCELCHCKLHATPLVLPRPHATDGTSVNRTAVFADFTERCPVPKLARTSRLVHSRTSAPERSVFPPRSLICFRSGVPVCFLQNARVCFYPAVPMHLPLLCSHGPLTVTRFCCAF